MVGSGVLGCSSVGLRLLWMQERCVLVLCAIEGERSRKRCNLSQVGLGMRVEMD